ncbi:uroporphyrin-III C-methyltransferase [Solidesulfovibrio carbinoliphilus subsp. oakridgensis]|uniref:uroporphyrinogen-III C-methyltransferase n=1 Tax=Solidesulfovibrio carbinoliphilus subsp. oakridgensis TaxID=694327 RepID=G7Q866_9BACT|nr:uroporphyrinogen-III C-methyltransferase [Solidesulfovibrio carbinoliphilus]EHJ48080.1 uroporphyrin-III C-methyltransferase [Solidesulfovibrio carbinoliphilus subsp. oakridgensis]
MSKVYLLGAGPGDPGLLTLRAKDILSRADVVVYDYLANKAFLDFCRPDAEIFYVGKKGGDHTLPQDKINGLLVEMAKAGKMVARLKGGDPYVFGRGGEEAEELVAAGCPFEVVPGVTSAVAAPAYAGIPITHRSFCSSVSFITGHEDPTKAESSLNWEAFAQSGSTLVFFMGVKNLPHITENLMRAGMSGDTPAALVRWGTTCRHKSLVATVATMPEAAARHGFAPPSLFIVGGVVSLHETLSWYEHRPLLGQGVVVTRSREQASDLVRLLAEEGACCYEFPAIEIAPLADTTPVRQAASRLYDYDWVIFTSVNGVKCFFAEVDALGLDARAFAGIRIAAIGPATAEALASKGLKADFLPERFVAESVVEGLLALGIADRRVLIPRAREARDVLPEKLAEAGADVSVLPVYDTRPVDQDPQEILEAIRAGEIRYVTFTSSSTVKNFFAKIPPAALQAAGTVKTAVIGPITAKTLAEYGLSADVMAAAYTVPALAEAIIADARADKAAGAATGTA